MKRKTLAIALGAALSASLAATAQADKLDDIIESGKLRCAVTLDFPPMGFRDENNNPAGFDVDYCADLAKVLGVEPEVVETPFPDRIPALAEERDQQWKRIGEALFLTDAEKRALLGLPPLAGA